MDSQIEQLERLAALHRAGSLTDAEYEAQKAADAREWLCSV